jgi:hypothetical protein
MAVFVYGAVTYVATFPAPRRRPGPLVHATAAASLAGSATSAPSSLVCRSLPPPIPMAPAAQSRGRAPLGTPAAAGAARAGGRAGGRRGRHSAAAASRLCAARRGLLHAAAARTSGAQSRSSSVHTPATYGCATSCGKGRVSRSAPGAWLLELAGPLLARPPARPPAPDLLLLLDQRLEPAAQVALGRVEEHDARPPVRARLEHRAGGGEGPCRCGCHRGAAAGGGGWCWCWGAVGCGLAASAAAPGATPQGARAGATAGPRSRAWEARARAAGQDGLLRWGCGADRAAALDRAGARAGRGVGARQSGRAGNVLCGGGEGAHTSRPLTRSKYSLPPRFIACSQPSSHRASCPPPSPPPAFPSVPRAGSRPTRACSRQIIDPHRGNDSADRRERRTARPRAP